MTISQPDPFGVIPESMHYAKELEEHLGADSWQHHDVNGWSTVFFEGEELSDEDVELPRGFDLVEIDHVDEDDGISETAGSLVRTRHP